jgi:ribonuclease D
MKLVDDVRGLTLACGALRGSDVFYLDTEFDSGREGTRLCLIQIGAGEEVFVVDALRLNDLTPLGALLGGPDRTWVLHAGQQDVPLLSERIGVGPSRIFDTQIAWALVSIEHSTSLAYLKYRLLGLRGEKTHQADDWRRRPLPETQLNYAADDVVHLPALYRALIERTMRLGRAETVFQASAESLIPAAESTTPLRVDAFRNAWQLEPEGQAVLRFLIDWYNTLDLRDQEAAPDVKGLFSIASRRPKTLDELSGLRAVPRRTVSGFGKTLVDGIQRAVRGAHSQEFLAIEPPPYATPIDLLASGWLEAARAELCTELEVAPELVLPSRLMRRLRDAAVSRGALAGAVEALVGWRRTLLEAPLLQKLERYGPLPGPGREVD